VRVTQEIDDMGVCEMLLTSDGSVRYKEEPKLDECFTFSETTFLEGAIRVETLVKEASVQVEQSVDGMGVCEMLLTSDGSVRYKEEPKLDECFTFSETTFLEGAIRVETLVKEASVQVEQSVDGMGVCEMLLTSDGSVRYKEEPKLDECFTFSETTFLEGAIRVETLVKEASVQVEQSVDGMGVCEILLTSDGSVRYKEEPKLNECASFLETTVLSESIRVSQSVNEMGFCEMLETSDTTMRYKEELEVRDCASFLETSVMIGSVRVTQEIDDMGVCEMLLASDASVRYKEEPKLDECFTFSETTFLEGAIRVETLVKEASVQVEQSVDGMGVCEMLLTSDGSVRYKEEPKLDECFTFSETTFLEGAIRVETLVKEASVQVEQSVDGMGVCEMLLTSDGSVRYKEEP
ncbi:hypothetical protein BOX15_Mlig000934g7, partial [Macrostomum lignano]